MAQHGGDPTTATDDSLEKMWSFSDQISVLEAAIEFKGKFNKDPTTATDDFLKFLKGKLEYTEFTKDHVMDKLRRLKNRYTEELVFLLSKKIWGEDDMMNGTDDENGVKDDMMKEVSEENKRMLEKDVLKPQEEEKDFQQLYPHLIKGLEGDWETYLSEVDTVVLEEWDRKWKKIHLAETRAYLKRSILVQAAILVAKVETLLETSPLMLDLRRARNLVFYDTAIHVKEGKK
ncbi:uncharacterized protein LOC141587423 isoform X1 [Silene latifolia]|uniref:uncharacterized protein LOC141587423 isoform X1 n=1 Tax=Silene latifolia TaxID=37657 RepID=UPI003D77E705